MYCDPNTNEEKKEKRVMEHVHRATGPAGEKSKNSTKQNETGNKIGGENFLPTDTNTKRINYFENKNKSNQNDSASESNINTIAIKTKEKKQTQKERQRWADAIGTHAGYKTNSQHKQGQENVDQSKLRNKRLKHFDNQLKDLSQSNQPSQQHENRVNLTIDKTNQDNLNQSQLRNHRLNHFVNKFQENSQTVAGSSKNNQSSQQHENKVKKSCFQSGVKKTNKGHESFRTVETISTLPEGTTLLQQSSGPSSVVNILSSSTEPAQKILCARGPKQSQQNWQNYKKQKNNETENARTQYDLGTSSNFSDFIPSTVCPHLNPEPTYSSQISRSSNDYIETIESNYNQPPTPPSRIKILKARGPERSTEKIIEDDKSKKILPTYSSTSMVTSTATSPGHSRPVIKGGVTDISRNHFGMEYNSNYNWDPCFSAIKNLERIFSYSSNQLPYGSGNEEPVDSNFWDQWYNKKEQTQQLSLGTPLFSEEAIHFFCDTSDSDSEERVDSIYEDEKSNEKEFEQSIQKYSSYTKDQIFIILNEKNITWASRIIPSLVFSNHVDVLHHLIDSTHENDSPPKCNDCRKFSAQDTLPQLVEHIEKHHFVSIFNKLETIHDNVQKHEAQIKSILKFRRKCKKSAKKVCTKKSCANHPFIDSSQALCDECFNHTFNTNCMFCIRTNEVCRLCLKFVCILHEESGVCQRCWSPTTYTEKIPKLKENTHSRQHFNESRQLRAFTGLKNTIKDLLCCTNKFNLNKNVEAMADTYSMPNKLYHNSCQLSMASNNTTFEDNQKSDADFMESNTSSPINDNRMAQHLIEHSYSKISISPEKYETSHHNFFDVISDEKDCDSQETNALVSSTEKRSSELPLTSERKKSQTCSTIDETTDDEVFFDAVDTVEPFKHVLKGGNPPETCNLCEQATTR